MNLTNTACSVWVFVHEFGVFNALSNPVFLGISLESERCILLQLSKSLCK